MSGDAGDANADRDDQLLAAYVDGITELSPEERHRIEARLARDPEARADEAGVRALLGQLRALPPSFDPPGTEPDWAAMERSIRQAVGGDVPRPWWRNWKWLAPVATFATAAMAVLVLWPRPELLETPAPAPAPFVERADRAPPSDETVALWLDGAEVDVDLSASELLGSDEGATGDGEPEIDDVGLLPAATFAWVDRLDDEAIARAERWLAENPSSPTSPSSPGPTTPTGRKG